jgi:serine/threonine-protein phosphatase 2A regulatory subunit A
VSTLLSTSPSPLTPLNQSLSMNPSNPPISTSLLPFLATHMDDDDEMLLKMAEELGAMVPSLVSGDKAQPVIDILEQLACVEETVVRNAAVASLTSVVGCMSPKVTGSLLDMVKRMSTADWFTGRVSACGVFGAVYEKVDAVAKDELRTLYKSLAEDETPMVRRSAAESLSSFATVVEKEHQPTDIVDIYKQLSQDEQDSVRQLAVKGAVAISKVISDPTANNNNVFPVVRNACNDKSWRVRHAVAKNYSSIASALQMSGDGAVEIIACFIGLLTDTEAEVRGAACVSIASMVEFAGESCFSTDIAPLLDGLSKDPVMEVRSKLSTALMDCTNPDICGKLTDAAILQTIQPILEAMLKNEEESDEVKINILRKLPGLSRVLSQMSEIVSVVVGLAKYQLNWRVRESVAKVRQSDER